MRSSRRIVAAVTLLMVLLAITGCTERTSDKTLTVLAASSLTETFTKLEGLYEAEHEGVDVRISFDSSSTLANQTVEGAPADVLATADDATMRTVREAGVTSSRPEVFATNTMVLVVPAGNPADIREIADLETDSITYVTCAESVPCGALAKSLLETNHVEAPPKSLEVDVKAVLTKVELDEADAGIVYKTDAVASGDQVEVIKIPKAARRVTRYPIVTLQQSQNPDDARQWVDLVLSPTGRDVLVDAGFGTP